MIDQGEKSPDVPSTNCMCHSFRRKENRLRIFPVATIGDSGASAARMLWPWIGYLLEKKACLEVVGELESRQETSHGWTQGAVLPTSSGWTQIPGCQSSVPVGGVFACFDSGNAESFESEPVFGYQCLLQGWRCSKVCSVLLIFLLIHPPHAFLTWTLPVLL
ncbi:hypothetical protein BKA81DRAFT_359917 [Phyllosticta paracitricarpa]